MLHNAWHVARGYEDITGKLTAVGARIESIEVEADPSVGSRTYE
jgi:UDP-N-acetylglucosamine enolpyruvyl transferase